MPIPAWNWPETGPFEGQDVLSALDRLECMQGHKDLTQQQKDFISQGVETCRKWLSSPEQPSRETRRTLAGYLAQISHLPRICHYRSPRLGAISHGVRIVAEHRTDLDKLFNHKDSHYDEFGDVFEPLTDLLRCEICFGTEAFNQIDHRTGRQYDWAYIGSVLKRYPFLHLPAWYRAEDRIAADSAMSLEHENLLISSRAATDALRMDFESVVWQIIKKSIYLENPNGPKQAVRTGNWKQLVANIIRATTLMEVIIQLPGEELQTMAKGAKSILQAVRCTQFKWFDSITSKDEFVLSDKAHELNRRLAETGDPRSNPELRSEPLFDIALHGRIRKVHSSAEATVYGDWGYDSERYLQSLIPTVLTTARARQTSETPTLVGGQSPRGTQAQAHLEPIPGYVLRARRRISRGRASAILDAYQRMVGIYERTPTDPAVADTNLTLLMAIVHPASYRTSFIANLVVHAGCTDAELASRALVRIPHRGLACKTTFDGFFEVSMDRNTVPSNATAAVEEILRAIRDGDDLALVRWGFHLTARSYEPLYKPDRVLAFVPLLQGMREYPPPANASPAERRRITLRVVDLTLTLYTLIAHTDLELVLGPVAEDPEALTRNAGESEAVLNIAGLSRHPRLGLIAVEGSLYEPAELNFDQPI